MEHGGEGLVFEHGHEDGIVRGLKVAFPACKGIAGRGQGLELDYGAGVIPIGPGCCVCDAVDTHFAASLV